MLQNLDFCPSFLKNLLKSGNVVWFVEGEKPSKEKRQKQGQQFWIENNILHTQTIKMFYSKNIKTGQYAESVLKRYLDDLKRASGRFEIKNSNTFWFKEDGKLKDAVKDLMERIGLSTKKKHRKGSYLDQIDAMWSNMELHWHKKREKKIDSFDASKSKAAVFKWMNKKYPDAIIVPEFGIGEKFAKSSIVDMAGFDKNKIIFVEIKAENDTFARLEKQLEKNMEIADEVWLAIYDKKKIPDIPDQIGVLSISSSGEVSVIKPASKLKQNKGWLGHIWYKEWQTILSRKSVLKDVKKQVKTEGADIAIQKVLKSKSRQFTIDVWRSRFQFEFLWRLYMIKSGDDAGASVKRGGVKERNAMVQFFYNNHKKSEKISLPEL